MKTHSFIKVILSMIVCFIPSLFGQTADQSIYTDSLVSPWLDDSWSSTITLNSTEHVYTGSRAIKTVASGWGGLSLRSGAWGDPIDVDPDDYTHLEFKVYNISSTLALDVFVENDGSESSSGILINNLPVNQWVNIAIPMTDFNQEEITIHSIVLRNFSGQEKTFYVDSIRFIGLPAPDTIPPTPTLLTPSASATNISKRPMLSWLSSEGVTTYWLQVSTSPAFLSTVFSDSTLTHTYQQITGLENSTIYYWRVRAKNSNGKSSFSSARQFTTVAPNTTDEYIYQDTLMSLWTTEPTWDTEITVQSTDYTFAGTYALKAEAEPWSALGFRSGDWGSPLEIDPSDYDSIAFEVYTSTEDLVLDLTIYNDDEGSSEGTSFSDIPTNQWVHVTLPMSEVNPENYMIHHVMIQNYTGLSPTYYIDNLRLVAHEATTAVPDAPILISPSNGGSEATPVTLVWHQPDTSVIDYQLQVAADSTFSAVIFNDSTLVDTTKVISSLIPGTVYFWRVNARNDDGRSSWSTVWSFMPQLEIEAPPIDTTVITTLYDAMKFLYEDSTSVQQDLDTSKLEATQMAVIRGVAIADCGVPLSGVHISILDHTEFGYTYTREDGIFDLVVNGGGFLNVKYSKSGYIPVQRQIYTPWFDFVSADTVLLVPVDSSATTITSNIDSVQVAQSSSITDADGTRNATVIFERYTQTIMNFPDSSSDSLSSFVFRATEYGLGSTCVSTLPASLPPTSALGYGAELTSDEAITAKAKEVVFDKAFALYVNNFLTFTIGTRVPAAYFDSTKGVWAPISDGRVVKIISIDSMANLDVTGSGSASSQTHLDSLGISNDERKAIAVLFSVNQSFMRIETKRLGSWTFSWPFGPATTAQWPKLPSPTKQTLDKDCTTSGSIIGIQNQTLGEVLPITGTPFSIYYKSDRVPGRTDAFTLNIPLSGSSLPTGLNKIYLEVEVVGRFFSYEFSPSTNLSYDFVWDRKDPFGRTMQGRQPVHTSIGYNYNSNFQVPTGGESFGNTSGTSLSKRRSYTTTTLWQHWSGLLGLWNETSRSLGSWTFNNHHLYDAVGGKMYYGDGNTRSAENANMVVQTYAGNGDVGPTPLYDSVSALSTKTGRVKDVAVGPDGSVYYSSGGFDMVRKITTTGIVLNVAGIMWDGVTSHSGYNGDSIAATSAKLNFPLGIDVGADGSVYIADYNNHRIRKVDPDGIITTIAGTGTAGFSGDGGLAINAQIRFPEDVAVAPDGSVYIADGGSNRCIRRINQNGIITTVAGTGGFSYNGDLLPGTQSSFSGFTKIAVGKDGSVYFGTYNTVSPQSLVRRLSPDGILRKFAGTGTDGFSGDCGPALSATMTRPFGITVDENDNVIFTDYAAAYYTPSNEYVRRVSSGGIIAALGGSGVYNDILGTPSQNYKTNERSSSQIPSRSAMLFKPTGLDVAPDGSIYFGEDENNRMTKLSKPFPQFSLNTKVIPSEDGSELFVFDYSGRHQQTLDALTGVVKFDFYYDGEGRLTHIRDIDSLFTTVERDSTGRAKAIISPYGQKTYLYINNNGYLDSLKNPAAETHRFTYSGGGLLATMRNGKNQLYQFTYDSLGRLIKDEDPLGGYKALARTELYDTTCSSCGKIGFEVTMTTALGKKTIYRVERVAPGGILITNTDENGQKTYTRENPDGSTTITSPDSTITTVVAGPDPRFGMMVPVDKNKTTRKPSGLTMTESHGRRISQMTGLQVTGLVDSSFVNGRLSKSEYNGTSRTITSTSPLGRKKVSFLDTKGRVIKDSIPGITPTTNTYNSKGQLTETKQGTRVTTFTYDAVGRLASITDPMLRVSSTDYDSVGRTLQQILTDGRSIGYTYDGNGNMTTLTPPSRPAHEFDYTNIDLDSVYSPPELPIDGFTPTHYEYNLDKQNTEITRPDSTTITFEYDSAKSQLKSISFDRGETHYQYNATSGLMTRLVSPTNDTLLFTYDGSSMTKEEWRGVVKGTVTSRIDSNFRVVTQTINGTDSITFKYNNDDQPTQIGALKLAYNTSNDQLLSDTLGSTSTGFTYSSVGELSGLRSKYSGSTLFATSYTRDSLGRITILNDTIQGVGKVFRYGYDLAGRLEKVWRNDTLISTYIYDSTGNRLVKITPTSSDSGTYDVQDRMLSYGTANYVYTKNGELQFKIEGTDTTRYTYDSFGNLITVLLQSGNRIDYIIDGQNRRIGKKINDTIIARWIYEGQLRPVAEVDSAGNIVARYIYGTKPNVPEYIIKAGATYRVVTDHLGSVRLIVNSSSGVVTQRIDYDEFGNILVDSNPGFSPFAFAGGLYDTQTKLVRFGVRDFDPKVGRWTSKDPILFNGGNVNLFGYVSNDPVNFVDKNGKWLSFALDFMRLLNAGAIQAAFGVGYEIGEGIVRGKNGWEIAENVGMEIFSYGVSFAIGTAILPEAKGFRGIGINLLYMTIESTESLNEGATKPRIRPSIQVFVPEGYGEDYIVAYNVVMSTTQRDATRVKQ